MARTQQPVSTPTPGEWQNDASRKYYKDHVIRKNGLIIAAIHTSALDRTRIDAEANGRLLAAAPELLAALRRLVNCPDVNEDELSPETIKALDDANDAIRKATGAP